MGGDMMRPQSRVASIYENPVTSALMGGSRYTSGKQGNYIDSIFGNGAYGDVGVGSTDIMANNPWGLEQIGKGVGIAGDLFGMYNQYQAMQAAKTGINNQNKLSNYNMANNTNFVNGTINAFGSGQAKTVNQFGSGV